MPQFTYKAVGANGQVISGNLEAHSRAIALQQLDAQQLQPISLLAQGETISSTPLSNSPVRLSQAQILLFTEDLADLLDAGLQLEAALKVIEDRPGASSLRQVAALLRQQVREGVSLSTALVKASPSFGELYSTMVAAGEASGALVPILRRQIAYLNLMQDLRRKVQQSLVYPAFIMAAGVATLILFVTVLMPQLNDLFRQTQTTIPFETRVLIGGLQWLETWWWLVLLFGAGAYGFFRAYIRTEKGKIWWHRVQLKIPGFGPIFENTFYSQFGYTLAGLIGNGIPLLQALRLTAQATPNLYFKKILIRMADMVGDGSSLARTMRISKNFPDLFIDIVGVGEKTGDLERALGRAATRYEKELNDRLTALMAMIQPAVILIIAIGVGFVAYTVISTILEAVSSLKVR